MALIIKRFIRPGMEGELEGTFFTVDIVNGSPGHELKIRINASLVGTYLRVGLERGSRWRTFKLRQDFIAAAKVQREDDISCSTVWCRLNSMSAMSGLHCLPAAQLQVRRKLRVPIYSNGPMMPFIEGLDKQTELDLSRPR